MTYYPEAIERTKEHISGFEKDIIKLESETALNEDGFSPMKSAAYSIPIEAK